MQYGVLTPQVGLIGDLKMSLSEKCSIPGHLLVRAIFFFFSFKKISFFILFLICLFLDSMFNVCVFRCLFRDPEIDIDIYDIPFIVCSFLSLPSPQCIASMADASALQIYSDSNPLRTVGEEQTLFAFEVVSNFSDILGHPLPDGTSGGRVGGGSNGGGGGDGGDLEMAAAADRTNPLLRDGGDGRNGDESAKKQSWEDGRFDNGVLHGCCGGCCSSKQPIHVGEGGDGDGGEEEEGSGGGRDQGVVRFLLNERVDACDYEGAWYAGTIVEIKESEEEFEVEERVGGQRNEIRDQEDSRRRMQSRLDGARSERAADTTTEMDAKRRERKQRCGKVCINFDGFADKYNEWYDIGKRIDYLPIVSCPDVFVL